MTDTTRRGYLKMVLSAIGGLAAGHSILVSNATAQPVAKVLKVRLPEKLVVTAMPSTTQRMLAPDSKRQVVDAIAPTLEHVVTAAGFDLDEAQLKGLREAFATRGVVTAGAGNIAEGVTLSLSGSLNYTTENLVVRQPQLRR